MLTTLLAGLTALPVPVPGAAASDGETVSLRMEKEEVSGTVTFWLTGSVAPFVPGQSATSVSLRIVDPDGSVVFDEPVALDETGAYRHEFLSGPGIESLGPFPRGVPPGLFEVSVSYGTAVSHALIPRARPIGSAIIVAGYQGSTDAVANLASYAYLVLRAQQIPSDRILVLHPDASPDLDFDGQPDVDAAPTTENLRFAVEQWALDRFNTTDEFGHLLTPLRSVRAHAAPPAPAAG